MVPGDGKYLKFRHYLTLPLIMTELDPVIFSLPTKEDARVKCGHDEKEWESGG